MLTRNPDLKSMDQQNSVVVRSDCLWTVARCRVKFRALTVKCRIFEVAENFYGLALLNIVNNCCSLEYLCVQNGSVTTQLLDVLGRRCPHLHTLVARRTCDEVSASNLQEFVQSCRDLTTLDVAVNAAMNDKALQWLAKYCDFLQELHIHAGASVTPEGLVRFVTRAEYLHTLHFHDGKDRAELEQCLVAIARTRGRTLSVRTGAA
jgi:hypothetical protein